MRKALFIIKVHPINYLFVWLLSLRYEIFFWHRESLPDRLLAKFNVIDSQDFFTRDEWEKDAEIALNNLKPAMKTWWARLSRLNFSVEETKIDITKLWLQEYCAQFNYQHFFLKIIEMWQKQNPKRGILLARSIIQTESEDIGAPLPVLSEVKVLHFFAWLDRLNNFLRAVAITGKHVKQLFRPKQLNVEQIEKIDALWMGCGQHEYSDSDHQIDATFLNSNESVDQGKILYVLNQQISERALERCSRNGGTWIMYDDLLGLLSWKNKLDFVLTALRIVVVHACKRRLKDRQATSLKFAIKCAAWKYIGDVLKPRLFFSSCSAENPEYAAVASMNALGVRTIVWFYSANSFFYARKLESFKDLKIFTAVHSSKELWVWCESMEKLFRSRFFLPDSENPKFVYTGPVMCGQSRFTELSSSEARAEYFGSRLSEKKKFDWYISVFEISPLNRDYRVKLGLWPTHYPLEMVEGFFADIEAAMKEFPNIGWIFKPKRELLDDVRVASNSMQRIFDPNSEYQKTGQVEIFPSRRDTYIPIGMSDICIGLPFTSPVVVGIYYGRHGFFHDPTSIVNYYQLQEAAPILTHGREQFLERIRSTVEKLERGEAPNDLNENHDYVVGPSWNDRRPADFFVEAIQGKDALSARGYAPTAKSFKNDLGSNDYLN